MSMASKDKDYRLISLVTDICPIPLRKYFLDLANSDTSPGVPFTTLDQYMVFRHRDVKTLMNFPQKSIRRHQYDLIYPKADETKWDVTLLSALLLGLFENQMKNGENSLIKVIREKRNKLQHKPGSVVTDDAEFDSDWNDIETATQSLALIVGGTRFENGVTEKIQAVKVNNLPRLGDTLRNWYEDIIIELKNEIKELKETSESSLQILQGVSHKRPISKGAPAKKVLKTVDVRVNKLRDYFRQTIERELPEDFKCQPEEREILRILQENHCVVVTGSENTSYLATVLSAINRSEKYPLDRCFELKTVDDWNSIDPNETDLVLFTEPFVEQQNECLRRLFQSMQDSCKMPSKEFRIDVVIVSENSKVNHWKENHDDNEIFKNVVELFMPTDENNPLNLEKRNITDKRHDVGGVFGNMIAQSEVFIQDCKTYASDNNELMDELMEQARQKFSDHKAIVITGLKGGTSTRFALKLVSSLYSKEQCVILTEASDWKQVKLGKVSVIVIDEFAGKYKYNTSFVEAWLNKFDIIYAAVIKGLLNVIVTCESSFFQKVIKNISSHALLNHRVRLPDIAFVNVVVKEEPLSHRPENPSSSNTGKKRWMHSPMPSQGPAGQSFSLGASTKSEPGSRPESSPSSRGSNSGPARPPQDLALHQAVIGSADRQMTLGDHINDIIHKDEREKNNQSTPLMVGGKSFLSQNVSIQSDDSAQESEQAQSTNEAVTPECGSFVEIVNDNKFIKEFCEVSDGTIVCTYQTFEGRETDTVKGKWFLAIFSLKTLNTVESKELAFKPYFLSSVQRTNEIILTNKMEVLELQTATVDNSSLMLGEIEKTRVHSFVHMKIAKIDSDCYIVCSETDIFIYDSNWTLKTRIEKFEGQPLFYKRYSRVTNPSSRRKNITDLTVGLNGFYVSSLERIIIFNLKGVVLKEIPTESIKTCMFNNQMLITLKENANVVSIYDLTDGTYVCSLNTPYSNVHRMYYGKKNKCLFVANFNMWSTCVVKTE